MSRTRTGHTPEAWRDDGPMAPAGMTRYFAVPLGGLMPVTVLSPHQNKKVVAARVICGQPMLKSGDICGRTPGHSNHCRSRIAVERDAGRKARRKRGTA